MEPPRLHRTEADVDPTVCHRALVAQTTDYMYLAFETAFERDQLGYGAFVVPEVFSCVKTLTTHHAVPI